MNNHCKILQKQASFDLKCSKMRWRLDLRPNPAGGAYDALPNPLVGMGFEPPALATRYFFNPSYSFSPNLSP